jgi:peptidoglycan/xylan/chitin deacetylase (PgdA/CDA1 family)
MQLHVLALLALPLATLPGLVSGQEYACPATCLPPACKCASTSIPGGLALQDTPQFVTFTFDDAIQQRNEDIMAPILSAYRNLNGCPLPATYFTQVQYTDFALVQQCASLGHEIALHTMTHQDLAKMGDPTPEIMGSFKALNAFAGVPKSQLRGFRAPFLSFTPKVFEVLRANGLQYDSSITLNPVTQGFWPFTLDAGFPVYPQPCVTCPAGPTMTYPGMRGP